MTNPVLVFPICSSLNAQELACWLSSCDSEIISPQGSDFYALRGARPTLSISRSNDFFFGIFLVLI